jgi:hypothetical protein
MRTLKRQGQGAERSSGAAMPRIAIPKPIAAERQQYVDFYRSQIEALRAGPDSFAVEVLLEMAETSSLFRRLYRVDFCVGPPSNLRIVECNVDPLSRTCKAFRIAENLDAVVHPVTWDDLELIVREGNLDPARVASWFDTWIDADSRRAEDDHGLAGVVHSMVFSERRIGLDLGSAPLEALAELLETLAQSGIRRIEIAASGLHGAEADQSRDK